MDKADVVKLLEANAYAVYMSCLVGNPAPRIARLLERLRNPQIGDLVLEISSIYTASRDGVRLGRLLRHSTEFISYEEEEGGYQQECWYIETLDGTEFRWHNADFIVVRDSLRDFR